MILLAVCHAAPSLYNDDELRVVGDLTGRAALLGFARDHQKKGRIRFRSGGEEVLAKALSYQELLLVQMAAKDGASSEYDLYIPTPEGRRPASLSIRGRDWVLSTATPVPVESVELVAASRRAKLVPRGSKPWEADVAQAIGVALELLSDEEIAAIQGVGLQRVAGIPRTEAGPSVATYLGEGSNSRIEVYDPAAAETFRFVGAPSRPYHPTSLVILHEVAHAIADGPIRALLAEHDRRRREALADQERIAKDVVAHNDAVRAHNARPVSGGAPALAERGKALQARSAALKEEVQVLNKAVEQLRDRDRSPIAAAFSKEVGGSPTRYGQTSPDEAFAEAFALYRLDPEALERVLPGAVAWFEQGRHVAPP